MDPWRAFREALKRIDRGDFEHATPEERARAASELIRSTSAAAAVSTLQPLPFVDAAVLTPMQHRMVQALATIHGYRLDKNAVRQLFRVFRPRVVISQMTMGLAKSVPLVPIVFDAVAVSVAYALTYSVGQVSDRYFRSRRRMSAVEMKASLEVLYKETCERLFRLTGNELRAMFRSPETGR